MELEPLAAEGADGAAASGAVLPQNDALAEEADSGDPAAAAMASPAGQEGRLQNLGKAIAPAEVRAYLERGRYGRVPAYLQEVLEVLEDEQEYIEALPALETEEPDPSDRRPVRLLTDREKTALLRGLAAKREQLTRCFEAEMEEHAEEAWRKRIQARYAAEVQQIDKDIDQMSQKYIFVASEG
mmetsp:Transcript_29951/g.75471  ORF Transcript_29951/g.75471 Transcript_29951/m.75471 type:complete len:184 (+) Transcript_29951:77-628(+)